MSDPQNVNTLTLDKPFAALSEPCFQQFLTLIHHLTGMTVAANRKVMVEGRVRKRATQLGLPHFEAYLECCKNDPSETLTFIHLITTHETYFFRTPRIWDYISEKLLPQWLAQNPQGVFQVWSAASASGEETYSLATACQAFKMQHPQFHYQILGTDISSEMIARCQAGRYEGRAVELFQQSKPEWFASYLKPVGPSGYEVRAELKAHVIFREHNLFHPLILSSQQFDLILLRNVLIYFANQDQERVLALLAAKLKAGLGRLIIGESESLSHIQTPYLALEPFIYQKPEAHPAALQAPPQQGTKP